jgi:hypothetical protein
MRISKGKMSIPESAIKNKNLCMEWPCTFNGGAGCLCPVFCNYQLDRLLYPHSRQMRIFITTINGIAQN